jgi:hydrogenase maturation factor HypF (carbamoyltransferase family)
VCGYGIEGENRSYKEEIQACANSISMGKIIKINTFYGTYNIGKLSEPANYFDYDIIAYDLATVSKYTNAKPHEITALGSIEKPSVKLSVNSNFNNDFSDISTKLINFKLADDLLLQLIMHELHSLGVNLIYIAKESFLADKELNLVQNPLNIEPLHVVTSDRNIAIVSGERALAKFSTSEEKVNSTIGAINSVVKEHNLEDENIAGIYLSKTKASNIVVKGQKYGTVKYLSFNFKINSISELFELIKSSNETGEKIIANYKKKFPQLYEEITKVEFEDNTFNIYKLWGIIAIVLGYTKGNNTLMASKIIEDNTIEFLGDKGPRIDYKLHNVDGKAYLDPLMVIRTAMSFKLAGVDDLTLSFGIIESFAEFISNELDELKQNMSTTAVCIAGSMLSNKKLFSKLSTEVSLNHTLYFNNQLPIDDTNILYGGNTIQ